MEHIYLLCVFISLRCIIFSQCSIFMQRTDQEQTTQTALFSVNTVIYTKFYYLTPSPSMLIYTRWREQVRAGTRA